jgi:hypothetical protein
VLVVTDVFVVFLKIERSDIDVFTV